MRITRAGSNPAAGVFGLIAQLGERETEDLKVLRLIRGQPIFFLFGVIVQRKNISFARKRPGIDPQ